MTTEEEFRSGGRTGQDSPFTNPEAFVCDLVTLVSEATGREPLELPPLVETVDPEAIQRCLLSGTTESVKVSFHYAGCEVVATSQGELFVHELPSSAA